jgi:hypothetical protein
MPQARQPMKNLWHSVDPFQGDEILSAYSQPSCFGNAPGPTVTITAPTNGQQIVAGQFFQVSATATDPTDGTKDDVVWTDGNGTTLGYGRQLLIVAQPGPQTLIASTIDSRYRVAKTSVGYTGTDQPPTAIIVSPAPSDSVYVGVPFLLQGQASDPNELLGLPCSSLVWASSVPTDPFPATGCYPVVTFTTTGSRTITLTATDPQGQFGTAQVTIAVSPQPTSGPPIVSLLSPHPTDFLAPNAQVSLHGFIVDPLGTGPLTYKWLLEDGSTETVLGSGSSATPSLDVQTPWTPAPSVTQSCGPKTVTIRLSVTGPGGTTVQSVTFEVNFPTC